MTGMPVDTQRSRRSESQIKALAQSILALLFIVVAVACGQPPNPLIGNWKLYAAHRHYFKSVLLHTLGVYQNNRNDNCRRQNFQRKCCL